MVVTYYIKLYLTKTDRHKGIVMSLLLLVAGGWKFSSYKIELGNRVMQNDVTLRVTYSKVFIDIFLLSY